MDKRFSDMTFPEQLSAYESACAEVSILKARLEEHERRVETFQAQAIRARR